MTDLTTKLLFAAIALGLWANLVAGLIRPSLAEQDYTRLLRNLDSNVSGIAIGVCVNSKIC